MTISVWILSDHQLFGEGLVSLLRNQAELSVELVLLSPATDLPVPEPARAPAVLLLDGQAAGTLEWCTRLAQRHQGAAVVIVGAPDDEAWSLDALCSGARGILARHAHLNELVKAVHVVRDGQIWAQKSVVARALALLSGVHGANGRLTPREHEVLGHLRRGLNNREIAERAAISQATVKAHLTSIFRKLSVRDRTQLVARYHGRTDASSTGGARPSSP